jgi:tight adherence protein B
VLVGGICALLIATALAVLFLQFSSNDRLQKRVATFIPDGEQEVPEDSAFATHSKGPKLLVAREWWPAFVEEVDVARIDRTPGDLAKLAAWGSLLIAVLIMVLSGSMLLAVLGLALGPVLLRLYVRRTARQQRKRFSGQLPSHLQDLAGAMRAGRSIVGAMSAVAESADQPIRAEFESALADERLGKPLEEALQTIGRRMQSEDMDQFALIAALNRRSGSNVAEALDRVADGARERADLKRELKALTSQAKISSSVLTGLPVVMLGALELLDPAYAKPLFNTTVGIVVVCVAAIMVVAGWKVMQRIVDVEA